MRHDGANMILNNDKKCNTALTDYLCNNRVCVITVTAYWLLRWYKRAGLTHSTGHLIGP